MMTLLVVPFEDTEWISGVGENFRLDNWKKLLGNITPDVEHKQKLMVQLMPEPNNKYDKKAIALIVNGIHVGYLPSEIAAVHNRVIKKIYTDGNQLVAYGSIWAVRRGKDFRANVSVNLPEKIESSKLISSDQAPEQPTKSAASRVSNEIKIEKIPSPWLEWTVSIVVMLLLGAIPGVGPLLLIAVLVLTIIFVQKKGWRIQKFLQSRKKSS
jgi:hypothetical protein